MELNRVLITGGAGMIARALPFGLKCSRAELDVRDRARAAEVVRAKSPSGILHLAAIDIFRAEADPLEAHFTNVLGTYNMALAAREARIPLVLVSSGAIFDGRKGQAHDEQAEPRPANIYGQGKWLAEILVRETLDDYLIVRGGWIFGGEQAHHKKFVELAIQKAKRDEPIDAAVDQWGSPTWVADFADELGRLMQASARGVIHIANSGMATPADMADEIVAALGSRSKVRRVKREQLSAGGPRRAESEALTSTLASLRPWREALRAYLLR